VEVYASDWGYIRIADSKFMNTVNTRLLTRAGKAYIKCFCLVGALIGLQCHSYQSLSCTRILKCMSGAILWADLADCRWESLLASSHDFYYVLVKNLVEIRVPNMPLGKLASFEGLQGALQRSW